jgi:hypothetical protein
MIAERYREPEPLHTARVRDIRYTKVRSVAATVRKRRGACPIKVLEPGMAPYRLAQETAYARFNGNVRHNWTGDRQSRLANAAERYREPETQQTARVRDIRDAKK